MKLADIPDLKSVGRNTVRVRLPYRPLDPRRRWGGLVHYHGKNKKTIQKEKIIKEILGDLGK